MSGTGVTLAAAYTPETPPPFTATDRIRREKPAWLGRGGVLFLHPLEARQHGSLQFGWARSDACVGSKRVEAAVEGGEGQGDTAVKGAWV